MGDGRIILRSYRLAFELERRIHRIDRYRIPLPYGLPLAALGYGAATLCVVLALSAAPAIGTALAIVPLPVRLVFLPGLVAHLLCRVGSDGRPMHEALLARLSYACRTRHLAALEPLPTRSDLSAVVALVADERSAEYRRGCLTGPVEITLQRPGTLLIRRRMAEVVPASGDALAEGRRVVVEAGQRVVLR